VASDPSSKMVSDEFTITFNRPPELVPNIDANSDDINSLQY